MATTTMSMAAPPRFNDEREITQQQHTGPRSVRSQYSHTLRSSSDSRPRGQTSSAGPSLYPQHGQEMVHVVDVFSEDFRQYGHGSQPGSVGSAKLAVPIFNHSRPGSEDRATTPIGPPPPSPPASVDRVALTDSPAQVDSKQLYEISAAVTNDDTPTDEFIVGSSTPRDPASVEYTYSEPATRTSGHGPEAPFLRRSMTSADAPASISSSPWASSSSPRDSPPRARAAASTADESALPERPAQTSVDGYLQPPALQRPTRRNTTGGLRRGAADRDRDRGAVATEDSALGADDGELATDIQLQAEQIRRERERRRAAAQAEAERALTRARSITDRGSEKGALVGNVISEGHVNYVLMYNMLTGIRVAVSRSQAKIKNPLNDVDFAACQKYSFDIIGNELTPSARYDFKFKDYAPAVFRALREDCFRLDPSDYLVSLTEKYILSELGSPGKSGSFFYFSRDYRFIIKTIHHSEHKFLRRVLPDYYKHVKENPHTLISRFYGLHRVKLPRGGKIHFVIMNNLFPPHKDVHETFDLKGSTVGREYPEEKAAGNPRAVLKDLNWIHRHRELVFGPEKRALLTEQLRRDAELLKRLGVMDYSLLVGIHHVARGNRDNVRRNTLRVFSPDVVPPFRRAATTANPLAHSSKGKHPASPEAAAMRHTMRQSNPRALQDGAVSELELGDAGERAHCVFYADDGGLRATDDTNRPESDIYYLGVIDILTPYNTLKKLEHFWKGLKDDRHKISPVPPTEYSDRFFDFMKAVMHGGGGAERFLPENDPQLQPVVESAPS